MKVKLFILAVGFFAIISSCGVTESRYRHHKPQRKSKIPSWTIQEVNPNCVQKS